MQHLSCRSPYQDVQIHPLTRLEIVGGRLTHAVVAEFHVSNNFAYKSGHTWCDLGQYGFPVSDKVSGPRGCSGPLITIGVEVVRAELRILKRIELYIADVHSQRRSYRPRPPTVRFKRVGATLVVPTRLKNGLPISKTLRFFQKSRSKRLLRGALGFGVNLQKHYPGKVAVRCRAVVQSIGQIMQNSLLGPTIEAIPENASIHHKIARATIDWSFHGTSMVFLKLPQLSDTELNEYYLEARQVSLPVCSGYARETILRPESTTSGGKGSSFEINFTSTQRGFMNYSLGTMKDDRQP